MKTQKIVFATAFTVLISSLQFPVFATDTTPTPSLRPRQEFRQERREAIKETRGEIKDLRQDLKTTIVQARATKAQERKTVWTALKKKQVQLVADRLIKELETRFGIVQKLKTKISDRITAKSATHDTAAASAKLALFSDAQYQTDLASLKTKVAAITTSDTPKDLLPGIRTAADIVRKDLRDLHLFLVEVMKLVATAPKK